MHGSLRCLLVATALAAGGAALADVRPRVLDARAGGWTTRLTVLDDGKRVHVSSIDGDSKYAGLIIDVVTGKVLHTVGGAGQSSETLGDGISTWLYPGQNALDVLLRARDGRNTEAGADVVDLATMRPLAELLKEEQVLLGVRTGGGPVVVTGGQGILPGASRATYTLRYWAKDVTAPRWTFDVPTSEPDAEYASAEVLMSLDGRWLAAVREETLHLIDAATGTARKVARVAEKPANSDSGDWHIAAGFSADGTLLYVADGAGEISVKRVADLSEVRRVPVPDQFVTRNIREHAGGKVLELGGRRTTLLLDTGSGQFLRQSRGGSGNSYLLNWLGDGRVLRAWRQRHQPLQFAVYTHAAGRFGETFKQTWQGAGIGTLATSPNGRCLFVAGRDRAAVLAAGSGQEIARLRLAGEVEAATFAMQGATLVAVDAKQRILEFEMPRLCRPR